MTRVETDAYGVELLIEGEAHLVLSWPDVERLAAALAHAQRTAGEE